MMVTSPNQNDLHRFTLDGSAELERRLAELCQKIRQAVLKLVAAPKLEALVLGGGYGRGQGGVLKCETGEAPYNDLEFYVFLAGNHLVNSLKYCETFRKLAESLSPQAKLHVEFKVDSLEKLRGSSVSIFSYDLVSRHRIIYGPPAVFLACEHHLDPNGIPAAEATRLLLNRCSGLLLAKELLLKSSLTDTESDFVGRNIAKANLALGDALLVTHGKYHWDCLERNRRLRELNPPTSPCFSQEVLKHHDAGVQFKLHPTRAANAIQDFRKEHLKVTELALREWLWIENQRLNESFENLREYSFSSVYKWPGNAWRNRLLNVKTFGAGATFDKNSQRYPRERLLNALPLLLASGEDGSESDTRHLQSQLRTQAADWAGLVAAYKQVWSSYG